MATHSSVLTWRTSWTEEPVHKVAKSQTLLKRLSTYAHGITVCYKGF